MSRITTALKKASQDRKAVNQTISVDAYYRKRGAMKSSWLIWIFVVGVVITVLIAFNYKGADDSVKLNEIFPDEKTSATDIQYEFADEAAQGAQQQPAMVSEGVVIEPEQPAAAVGSVVQETAPIQTETTVAEKTEKSEIDFSKLAFTVQVSSFKEKAKAEQTVAALKNKSYDGFLVTRNLGDKGIWYRVYVGQFENKADAQAFHDKFKLDYKDSFIISPKK